MNGRIVYRPAPARRTLFGLPLTARLVGVALAQAIGMAAVAGALYLILVVCMALSPAAGLN